MSEKILLSVLSLLSVSPFPVPVQCPCLSSLSFSVPVWPCLAYCLASPACLCPSVTVLSFHIHQFLYLPVIVYPTIYAFLYLPILSSYFLVLVCLLLFQCSCLPLSVLLYLSVLPIPVSSVILCLSLAVYEAWVHTRTYCTVWVLENSHFLVSTIFGLKKVQKLKRKKKTK